MPTGTIIKGDSGHT